MIAVGNTGTAGGIKYCVNSTSNTTSAISSYYTSCSSGTTATSWEQEVNLTCEIEDFGDTSTFDGILNNSGWIIKARNYNWTTESVELNYKIYRYGNLSPDILFSPKDRIKQIIKDRYSPAIITSKNRLPLPQDVREVRARETLRRIVGFHNFKQFLKKGFVTIKGKSGLTYQIFTGHGITAVYKNGEMVERLCVIMSGNFAPTDSLIMRYLLILNNEERFRNLAVPHSVYKNTPKELIKDKRSIVEIYNELKAA